uniref:Protein FAM114A2 n=1 Tax=Tabanus bromius TaxID=304241 RepID=A0A0K8TRS9_TABBR
MSSSESEAFESADEDFDSQEKPVPERQKKVTKPVEIDKTSNNEAAIISSDKNDVRGNVNDGVVNKNKETSVKLDEPKKPSILDEYATPPSIVHCWEEGCNNSNFPTSQEVPKHTDKDEQKTCDPQRKTPERKTEQPKESESAAEEGWSDFDDWGDEDDAVDEKKPEANDQKKAATDADDTFFPVLKELSTPDTSNKNEKGLFQNLSKLVPNPTQMLSSYDTFPVLDKISTSNKCNEAKPFPVEEHVETPAPQKHETASAATAKSTSSWGWGGVVSLLSSATEGVTSALSSVIESGMGVPEPEEMAKLQKELEEKRKQSIATGEETPESRDKTPEDKVLHGLGHIVSGVTSIGNKVITGGLDTLEGIGKKTMTILQENDPLLLNKRKLLGLETDKPVLSQVLREAKKKSEEAENNLKQMQKHLYKKQLHFETLFDHYHGLVHLEALEMLSKQSSIRLESLMQPLSGKALAEVQETLNEVEEFCDLGDIENYDAPDDLYPVEELSEKLKNSVEDLGIEVEFPEILKCWEENSNWLKSTDEREAKEVYDKSLRSLAETAALIVHKMHKLAELLLVKEHHSTANEADSIVQLTTTFCWHINGVSNCFARKLNTFDTSEEISSMITNLFVEQSNSTSCIRNVFQLFIPILQVGAV